MVKNTFAKERHFPDNLISSTTKFSLARLPSSAIFINITDNRYAEENTQKNCRSTEIDIVVRRAVIYVRTHN